MNFYSPAMDKIGGNGSKAYRCVVCGGLVASSDQLLFLGGDSRHLFANPAGMECDFHPLFSFRGCAVGVKEGKNRDR